MRISGCALGDHSRANTLHVTAHASEFVPNAVCRTIRRSAPLDKARAALSIERKVILSSVGSSRTLCRDRQSQTELYCDVPRMIIARLLSVACRKLGVESRHIWQFVRQYQLSLQCRHTFACVSGNHGRADGCAACRGLPQICGTRQNRGRVLAQGAHAGRNGTDVPQKAGCGGPDAAGR
jgi:hypothetical protein